MNHYGEGGLKLKRDRSAYFTVLWSLIVKEKRLFSLSYSLVYISYKWLFKYPFVWNYFRKLLKYIKPQLKTNNSTIIEKMRSINQLLDSWLYSKGAVMAIFKWSRRGCIQREQSVTFSNFWNNEVSSNKH